MDKRYGSRVPRYLSTGKVGTPTGIVINRGWKLEDVHGLDGIQAGWVLPDPPAAHKPHTAHGS